MNMRITETALRRAIRAEALSILQEDIRVGDLRAQLRAAKGKKLKDADDASLPDADVQLNSWLKSNYDGTQVLKQK
jgi:hypothetical protein